MDGWMDGLTGGWMYGWMDAWMLESTEGLFSWHAVTLRKRMSTESLSRTVVQIASNYRGVGVWQVSDPPFDDALRDFPHSGERKPMPIC